MRVLIQCEKCTAATEVHITGKWDIKQVKHDCTIKPGMTPRERMDARIWRRPIEVVFAPPRGAF